MGIGVPVVTDGERTVCMDSIAKSSSPSLPPGIEELRSVCPYLPELCWIIRDKVVRGALHGMMLARDQVRPIFHGVDFGLTTGELIIL